MASDEFLRGLPKAELHVHIEGTLEPELMFEIAKRNGIPTSHGSVEQLRAAYEFSNLQQFLDIYYVGAAALQTEQDFYDMTLAYLRRAAADGVRRAEIFFDPQTHTQRGIPLDVVINGISAAIDTGESELPISADPIMCFLRHLPAEAAMKTLDDALRFRDRLIGVGLDSSEVGYPPDTFAGVFARAAAEDLHLVAHAGEEGPPDYVWGALDLLHVERIDHGNRALEDDELVARLVDEQMPLTVCPLSNVKLGAFSRLEDHILPHMLDLGLNVTINSDDPAYFGGYVGDNYTEVYNRLDLTMEQMIAMARSSINAAFLAAEQKKALLAGLDEYVSHPTQG